MPAMARVVHHIKRQEANAREIILKRHRDYESFKDLVRSPQAEEHDVELALGSQIAQMSALQKNTM